jgi:hypothetical protein
MSEGSIGTVRAARSRTSPWATQVGYTAFAWARLFATAYVHWAFGGTALLGENSGQSAGNLFDQDPLSYVIGRLNGFPTSFMHRGYHLSRVPPSATRRASPPTARWHSSSVARLSRSGRSSTRAGNGNPPRLRRHLARVWSKPRARGWARKAREDMAENKSARPYTERRRS